MKKIKSENGRDGHKHNTETPFRFLFLGKKTPYFIFIFPKDFENGPRRAESYKEIKQGLNNHFVFEKN